MRVAERGLIRGAVAVALLIAGLLPAGASDADDYQVDVKVTRQEQRFNAAASFHVPLNACEAFRYLTDYDAARQVSGVLDSKATRLGPHKVRVERWAEERVLMFPVKLHSVIEYTELPHYGTEFSQLEGDVKQFKGQWRIEPEPGGSVFRFQGVMEPDSALPMFILQHFVQSKMRDRFGEMARNGAVRQGKPVQPCEG